MPQEFQVLQCYSCLTFQVHQVKKTTKWACKMCGEKQSLKKVFGRGSGAECRQHVQKLNTMREEIDENAQSLRAQSYVGSDHLMTQQDQVNIDSLSRHEIHFQEKQLSQSNKWKAFVEDGLSVSSNFDDDDDDDDSYNNRYTTDAVKFKQGRKRKRESKGGNYCKNVSEKWTEFTGATNTGLYGNSSAYNIEEESGLNELPTCISSGSWQSQLSNSAGNNHEIYNQDSSLWRNKLSTYDTDEPFSQESFSNSVNKNFAKRIKSETHSTNMSKIKGNSDWMKGNNTMKSTEWSTYTESDLSSQESQNDNLEGLPETDSRPYVTFDPSGESSKIFKGCHEEPVSVADNTWDDNPSRERNDERNNTKFSKWTGFINSAKDWNQSDAEQNYNAGKQNYSKCADSNTVGGAGKQNYSKGADSNAVGGAGKQNYSKWTEYTGEDDKSSREEQEENCQLLTTVKINTSLSDDNNFELKQSTIEHSLSQRHLKSIGNHFNTGRLANNVKVKPLFTTGDLDDADFEL